MTNASLPENTASIYVFDNRYPRPPLVRAFRWLLIRWWILLLIGLVGLGTYLLLAFNSHVLLNQLLYLLQNWWIILLLVVVLVVVGIAIYFSYDWAYLDEWSESRELLRREHAEAEQIEFPSGFHLRHKLQKQFHLNEIVWSPDGHMLASVSSESTIRLWDADSGKELRTLGGHTGRVSSVAWSPDGHILASGSYDKTIRLWDADSGKELRTLGDIIPMSTV